MIIAEIKMDGDFATQVVGKTIEEVLEKVKSYHTMTDFEREHYSKKGKLEEILSTGWYMKETK